MLLFILRGAPRTAVRVVVCLFAASLACSAGATTLALPIEATNLPAGDARAIWQLVLDSYQTERRDAVVPLGVGEAEAESPAAAAARVGAGELLRVSAVRLAERVVITAALYSVDGRLLHGAKITATTLDDVEPASERLAKALVRQTNTAATRDLDNITKTEGTRPNRTWVQRNGGVKVAFVYPLGYGNDIAPLLMAGANGRFEGRSHFLEFGAGIILPQYTEELAYGGLYSEFGANWYLNQADTSGYLGVGLLPRLVSDSLINLAPYVQAGVTFFRESSTRVYFELRVAQNVLPVGFNRDTDYDPVTGAPLDDGQRRLYPTEFSLSLGLGF